MDCWDKIDKIFAQNGCWPKCNSCGEEMSPEGSDCDFICTNCKNDDKASSST